MLMPDHIDAFLEIKRTLAINEAIQKQTNSLTGHLNHEVEKAQTLLEWVRDEIPHTKDIQKEIVTCSSIDVFSAGTGICFAKSHLLASMMRITKIPCGFCYQIFENDSSTETDTLALHGLNAIYLTSTGKWHRIDPRGNRDEINGQFSIREEILAFPEMIFLDNNIYAEPLPDVVQTLHASNSIKELWPVLPSVSKNNI